VDGVSVRQAADVGVEATCHRGSGGGGIGQRFRHLRGDLVELTLGLRAAVDWRELIVLGRTGEPAGAASRDEDLLEAVVEELRCEKDPLAVHIFVSRRNYRNVHDTKSGKRHHLSARLSWQQA